VRQAVPEAIEQGFVEILNQVYRTGEPFSGKELPIDLAQTDGKTKRFYLNFVYQPLRDGDDKVCGIVAIIQDVTEQVISRQTLIFERNQLETIFRMSPAAMVLWSGPNFVFEKVNPHYQAIFPDRVLLGKPFLEACPEFEGQPFQELLTQVLETGEPFIGREILARHADFQGGPMVDHYYDLTYMRVNDSDGKPYGVYNHAIDVTDKVRARETIQNQNLWLEEVLNRLPIGLIMAEPDTANYRFTNQIARQMLGQDPRAIRLGLGPDKVVVRDLNENILSVDETPSARAARGEELTNEVIILEKEGTRIFVSCNSNIIPAMPGHKETVLIPFSDISSLKAKELELERSVKDLEENKNKLLITVGELEFERDLRERFVAALTHDLRTPLTAAKMSVQLMQRAPPKTAKNHNYLKSLNNSLERIEDMIRDLLDVTRINAGEEVPLMFKECNLREIVSATLADLIAVHGDRFIIDPSGSGEIFGYWDASSIRRMLENLAINAVKYGDPETPITIGIKQNATIVELHVHNLGNPIPSEDQAGLFQLFKRTRSASQGGQKGWGIGLTLVHGLVKAHGGIATVESSAARGTTFKIMLQRDSRSAK
jgi:signal transduction histidine kinase